jgi:hypothetical protein
MRHLNNAAFLLVALLSLQACASSGAAGGNPPTATSSPDYLTSIEISGTQAANAYEIITRLRPRWLQAGRIGSMSGGVRTQVIAVYLDGQRVVGQDALRSISSSGIKTMRFLDATRAATVLRETGSEPIAGAILITSTKVQ